MTRYFVKAAVWNSPNYDEWEGRAAAIGKLASGSPTVFENEREPRDTGLLDKDGRKIMASEDTPKIGFLP